MITVTRIIGTVSEPSIADRLHRLAHDDRVEFLTIDRENTQRRRLRASTEKGTDVAIALGSAERLVDGSVLFLSEERAIVLRVNQERWLRIKPRDEDAAIELGYCAGNHHWRVRFEPGVLLIALQGPADDYLSSLDQLLKQRKIEWTCDE